MRLQPAYHISKLPSQRQIDLIREMICRTGSSYREPKTGQEADAMIKELRNLPTRRSMNSAYKAKIC
jgi:Fe-S-cluster containining protein